MDQNTYYAMWHPEWTVFWGWRLFRVSRCGKVENHRRNGRTVYFRDPKKAQRRADKLNNSKETSHASR